ncbi:hypothetical protein [Albidovulum aquaemixtae]|nr:hypothetical protein [Defluviimonas aquaemixtae]
MSLVAAAARGHVRAGDEILVLCSGGGLVLSALDENGALTGKRHLCPDLAPAFLTGLRAIAADIGRTATLAESVAVAATAMPDAATCPSLRARDRPVKF